MSDEIVARTRRIYDVIAPRFLERTRARDALIEPMDRFVATLAPGAQVIDAGGGPGIDAAELRRRGLRTIVCDLSLGMLRAGAAEFPGPRVQADLRRPPFARIADGLWINASLLHLVRDDVPRALRAWLGVLRPGGVVHLSLKRGHGEGWDDARYGPEAARFFAYWEPAPLDAMLAGLGFETLAAVEREGRGDRWLERLVRAPG